MSSGHLEPDDNQIKERLPTQYVVAGCANSVPEALAEGARPSAEPLLLTDCKDQDAGFRRLRSVLGIHPLGEFRHEICYGCALILVEEVARRKRVE